MLWENSLQQQNLKTCCDHGTEVRFQRPTGRLSVEMEVNFTQPYPIGTLSQMKSIPLTSASEYIRQRCMHTCKLYSFRKHCQATEEVFAENTICSCFVVSEGNKNFHHALSYPALKWYQGVIRSSPIYSVLLECSQSSKRWRDWWWEHFIASLPNPNYTSGKAKAMGSACNLLKHNHSHA